MVKVSSILCAALLIFVAIAFVIETSEAGGEGSLKLEECPKACGYRCSETHHKKPCKFFCNYCCKKCLCVPSDTYGRKDECPCYRDWKTQEGKPKCP